MKTTEKIALLYLRLNGFFLMSHFTIFDEDERHRHVDVLGIRPRGSKEEVGGEQLYLDKEFIEALDGYSKDVRLWAEVGTVTVDAETLFPRKKERYCHKILGGDDLRKVYFDFDRKGETFEKSWDILIVPPKRCETTILSRFEQMESEPMKSELKGLSKEGSWSWSEDFLADLLYLRKMGFLKKIRSAK